MHQPKDYNRLRIENAQGLTGAPSMSPKVQPAMQGQARKNSFPMPNPLPME